MNSLIKDKIRQMREENRTLELKKDSLNDKVKMQSNFIEEIEQQGKGRIEDNKQKITNLFSECDDYVSENEAFENDVHDLTKSQEMLTGSKEKLRELGNLKGKISQKVSTITKEHKFFTEHTVCPTCTQDIDEDFRLNKIADAQSKAKELKSGYTQLEEAIKQEEEREHQFLTVSKEITNLTHGISKNNTRISGCQRQIRDLESEIQTITEQLADRNTEHEKLESFKKGLDETYESLATKNDTVRYYDFSYGLLKDGGVKSKIIKKYLPLINQQINRYLQIMDFYINFTLDEEFNETVQSPIHDNFSYSSFSEGEKMRIDLALLFTWREVARFKNSVNTNLLILDEIFDSSLDEFGTEYFTKIIRFVIQDANVFIISHKTGMDDKFDSVLKFEKVKGFSRANP
jgi:DNA repair exonuclease SbcCD ATPase subunit